MKSLLTILLATMLLTGCPLQNAASVDPEAVVASPCVEDTNSAVVIDDKADTKAVVDKKDKKTEKKLGLVCPPAVDAPVAVEAKSTTAAKAPETIAAEILATPVVGDIIRAVIAATTPVVPLKYALITLSKEAYAFSGVLNTESFVTLAMSNSGDAAATKISLSALQSSYRVASNDCGDSLEAGKSCAIVVGYLPLANADSAQTLTVSYNDGQDNKSKACAFTGRTMPNIASISPSGSVATQSLILSGSNFTSQTEIKIGTVVCPKTSVTASQVVCTLPIGSGSQVVSAGEGGNLSQYSNFTYLAPANISLSSVSHDFGRIRRNNTASYNVTLTNNGGFLASGITIVANAPFSSTGSCASLAPAASCVIALNYAPTSVRSDSDDITLSYNTGMAVASLSHSVSGVAIPKVVQLASNNNIRCVLYSEGNIKCIGAADFLGYEGITSIFNWNDANDVEGITNATQLAIGNAIACARLADGTVKCWHNYLPPLVTNFTVPQTIAGITTAAEVRIGEGFVSIRLDDGSLVSWGVNDFYPLGHPTSSVPQAVTGIPENYQITSHANGDNHSVAITTAGNVIMWGRKIIDQAGCLNTGGIAGCVFMQPIQINNLTNIVKVSGGSNFSCALNNTGTINCWGYNLDGSLGNGALFAADGLPVNPSPVVNSALQVQNDFIDIQSNSTQSCAIRSNKTVACWGANSWGELGNGTLTKSPYASAVLGLTNVSQIAMGLKNTMALTENGDVYVWGYLMTNPASSLQLAPLKLTIE